MSIELKKRFEIPIKGNIEQDISLLIRSLELNFKHNGFRIIKTDNSITFRRIIRTTTHSGNNRLEHFRLFRVGTILLSKKKNDILSIAYKVDIDSLIILSIGLLGILGIFCMISLEIELLSGLLLGVLPAGLFYLIGYHLIVRKMNFILTEVLIKNNKA